MTWGTEQNGFNDVGRRENVLEDENGNVGFYFVRGLGETLENAVL